MNMSILNFKAPGRQLKGSMEALFLGQLLDGEVDKILEGSQYYWRGQEGRGNT